MWRALKDLSVTEKVFIKVILRIKSGYIHIHGDLALLFVPTKFQKFLSSSGIDLVFWWNFLLTIIISTAVLRICVRFGERSSCCLLSVKSFCT